MEENSINVNTYAGINPSAQAIIDNIFPASEKKIVKYWANEWYITNAGIINLDRSNYKYILVKPTLVLENALNITRELVVIFSEYKTFEARTLEAFGKLEDKLIAQRYEKLCYVLISADENIEKVINEYLSNQENQIIVSFSYKSFEENKNNNHFLRNQFRKYFYSRDLFDISEPLKKDTFFFGRSDIVTSIIEKHKLGQNNGLFGLRKTGKTSIIYDVLRKSALNDFIGVFIDCQDTSFNMCRWNKALYRIVEIIRNELDIKNTLEEEDFTEENSSKLFAQFISNVYNNNNKKLLLLFDEVENITFGKSSVEHWCNGLDFVHFWQSIRSAYQTLSDEFTFCLFGTNAKCVEQPAILGKDNPIYNMFQPNYIPGFNYEQTREMIRKLGRIMGIKFDEGIYTRLIEDYGGHPFLMRRVCSRIARIYKDRPVIIDRLKYNEAKRQFNLEDSYFDMILDVLKQFYPDEYEMLEMLAAEDYSNFNFYAIQDNSLIRHLLGYGLIIEHDGLYDFKIDAIKEYLLRKNNPFKHTNTMTIEEKWSYLCINRNKFEIKLRKMVKNILKIAHKNETAAKEYVIKKIYADNKKLYSLSYNDLFDSKVCDIYLNNLLTLIKADWEYFADYFGKQDAFEVHMKVLNNEGRFDAHATIPSTSEIDAVEKSLTYLNSSVEKFINDI